MLTPSKIDVPWALRLDVGISSDLALLRGRDVDNFAKPLASRLQNDALVSGWCTKQHDQRSFVRIEAACERPAPSTDVLRVTTSGSWDFHAAHKQIRASIADATELPDGAVKLEIAFAIGLGSRRNWLNLRKPTIDSLGPLLGHDLPFDVWNPRDGRITELRMHLSVDSSLGYDVVIGISAAPA